MPNAGVLPPPVFSTAYTRYLREPLGRPRLASLAWHDPLSGGAAAEKSRRFTVVSSSVCSPRESHATFGLHLFAQ